MVTKKKAWNSEKVVGQKSGFTGDQIEFTEAQLFAMNDWHDLALLSLGLNSMLRASDLLSLTVDKLMYPNGAVRSKIPTKQQKTKRRVVPVLDAETRAYVANWIRITGKQRQHFLFTRRKAIDALPITRGYYADLVKKWASWVGENPAEFSTHSIRRSKPIQMYEGGVDIVLISRLLGHKSTAATIEYLGIDQRKAEAASLSFPMVKGLLKE